MKSEQNWNTNGTIHAIPRLYVMVGCPGSGKSTWAKKHLPNTYYVSRDEVRFSISEYSAEEQRDYVDILKPFTGTVVDKIRRTMPLI